MGNPRLRVPRNVRKISMEKYIGRYRREALFDCDDDELPTFSKVKISGDLLKKYLDGLENKRGSTREEALNGFIEAFGSCLQPQFAKKYCITLQHNFVNSIKRGSTAEASLASHALGLLAIMVGAGDNAHEILNESIPHLSHALESESESPNGSPICVILDCLAIITFVGGNNWNETERSMQIMWQFIQSILGSNVAIANKCAPLLLATTISAWSFLLTTIDAWNVHSNKWKESISFLSSLLERQDPSVCIAAIEAIVLIFEMGNLEKFSGEFRSCIDGSPEALKEKIINQVRNLALYVETGEEDSAKIDLSSKPNLFRDVFSFFETGNFPKTSVKILQGAKLLKISTWTQLLQLNFLKRVLGRGFVRHMQENELLHDIFDLTPKEKQRKLENDGQLLDNNEKGMLNLPKNASKKEKTQLMNKQRMWSQDRKNRHYAVAFTNEEA
ncbi:uncharacterized protein LOC143887472 isoform X1 [Tasmannia lanceolata]|uniref:uncharacterized protein LOC143887472 isoform X1 n=1 Tax=Tasmannia lanceolata TaxID=3420 RepID=UPI00406481AF